MLSKDTRTGAHAGVDPTLDGRALHDALQSLRIGPCVEGGTGWILTPLIVSVVYSARSQLVARHLVLCVESDYVLTARRFFDEEGNVTKIQGTASGTDTFINSADLTKTIEAPFQNTFLGDPQTPQRATTGIIFKVIVPGVGAVLLEIGRLVFQAGEFVFQSGPQQFTDGDLDALCAALT